MTQRPSGHLPQDQRRADSCCRTGLQLIKASQPHRRVPPMSRLYYYPCPYVLAEELRSPEVTGRQGGGQLGSEPGAYVAST